MFMSISEKKCILCVIIFLVLFANKTFALLEMQISDYPKEILIESGWMLNFDVTITNTGNQNLHNAVISVGNDLSNWFQVQTNKTSILAPNDNSTFRVKLSVPSDAEMKTYSFYLITKSDETNDIKDLIVRVFSSQKDLMLYQIQTLEDAVKEIEVNTSKTEKAGKDVTSIRNILDEIKNSLNDAKSYISAGAYTKATEVMRNIENQITEAEYDLSIASPSTSFASGGSSFPFELLIVIPVIPIIIIVFYIVKIKRAKKEIAIKIPPMKIKEYILEGRENRNLTEELEKLKISRDLLEEEFRDNIISKETYDELRIKYERNIFEVENEIKRTQKIA
jgi:hypothetical protein